MASLWKQVESILPSQYWSSTKNFARRYLDAHGTVFAYGVQLRNEKRYSVPRDGVRDILERDVLSCAMGLLRDSPHHTSEKADALDAAVRQLIEHDMEEFMLTAYAGFESVGEGTHTKRHRMKQISDAFIKELTDVEEMIRRREPHSNP